jgi:hypothetical protein
VSQVTTSARITIAWTIVSGSQLWRHDCIDVGPMEHQKTDVLVQFNTILIAPNGSGWAPRVCGHAREDGLWEGWIEFDAASEAAEPLCTSRESVQPNRDDLAYWAKGLSQTYLEGALARAVGPIHVATRSTTQTAPPRAVLNPFDVWAQGEDVLVRQLGALSSAHLREIALAYRLATGDAVDAATDESLVPIILDGVKSRRA